MRIPYIPDVPAKSLSIFHNHPGGLHMLSLADALASLRGDIANVEAVSANGWTRLTAKARGPAMRGTLEKWKDRWANPKATWKKKLKGAWSGWNGLTRRSNTAILKCTQKGGFGHDKTRDN